MGDKGTRMKKKRKGIPEETWNMKVAVGWRKDKNEARSRSSSKIISSLENPVIQ